MGSAYAKSWKKDMSDWERLYGNGVVYVSDGKMVSEFPAHNFDIESLEDRTGCDFWITGEVVVAVGAGCTSKKQVASALKKIAERIEKTPKKKFNPLSRI